MNVNKTQDVGGLLICFTEQILTQLYVAVVALIILTTLNFCPELQACRNQESHSKIANKSTLENNVTILESPLAQLLCNF